MESLLGVLEFCSSFAFRMIDFGIGFLSLIVLIRFSLDCAFAVVVCAAFFSFECLCRRGAGLKGFDLERETWK